MNKLRFWATVAVAGAFLMLSGCDLPTGSKTVPDAEAGDAAGQVDDLFVSSGSEIVFRCNSVEYWTKYGYTLWGVSSAGSSGGTFATRTVNVGKVSGNADAGYGIILCHGTNSDGDVSMFTVMINKNGYYTIGKVINARYVSILSWTYSAFLAKDGATNALTVAYDASSSEYVLSLNGTEACRFSDGDNTVNANGANGYIVVISPQDTFPADTVEVRFEEK
jgi:hypothetical protein